MRAALVLVLAAACSKSSGPSPDFKNDVEVFCGAIDEGEMTSIADLGPRILPRIRTEQFKNLFNMRREDPTGALFDRLEAAGKQAGLATCPTLEWMRTGMKAP